jgi:Replication-relaxation
VGRHPFQPPERLAAVLGWQVKWARQIRNRLMARGLMRLLGPEEVGVDGGVPELVELTEAGLGIVAAQQGLSLPAAVRYNGLAGGGPDNPIGSRRQLVAHLSHTLGVDGIFVDLTETARKAADSGIDEALLEWRNAAACCRRHLRPDGYGLYRRGGRLYGFFLEYDRGTMSARDYLQKFAAHFDYLTTGGFNRDYEGFPTILVVTKDRTAEERIARAAGAAAVGRGASLPLLLTCEWRIRSDPRNPEGLLGPIWREPDRSFQDRRGWQINQPMKTKGTAELSVRDSAGRQVVPGAAGSPA